MGVGCLNMNAAAVVSGDDHGRRLLAAVAFADVVNFSTMMAADQAGTYARWMAVLNEIIRPRAEAHGGLILKLTGDGVLARFGSVLDAVEWAVEVQRAISDLADAAVSDSAAIELRIAVHLGDIIATADDVYGDGVNVAARLQEHATPGGIVLSEVVHDLVRSFAGERSVDLGLRQLKGFERPLRIFALEPETSVRIRAVPRQNSTPSIAVLPLQNSGGDPADAYFADGLAEDIIVSLAGLGELFVIARGSTLAFRGKQADPRDAARVLGVRYVLVGSMRRSATLIRVSAQLFDGMTGATIWTEVAVAPPGELFDMQDRIVTKIVSGIAPNVRIAELRNVMRKRPGSFTAYDHTLRALHAMYDFGDAGFAQARSYLAAAMSEDPFFAMPFAWAAWWHVLNVGQGLTRDHDDDMAQAGSLAGRAIELDGHNALALAIYGHVKSFLFHHYEIGRLYLDRAVSVGASSALAWTLSGASFAYVGRADEAVRHAEQGLRLSPLDRSLFFTHNILCIANYIAEDYEAAADWGRLAAAENPLFTATHRILAASLVALGNVHEANAVAADMLRLEPEFRVSTWERRRQPFRDEAVKQAYAERLRRAGLPD